MKTETIYINCDNYITIKYYDYQEQAQIRKIIVKKQKIIVNSERKIVNIKK